MEPAVRFDDAVVLLDRFPALAGVDLHIGRGEIVLLQGPNGAGKTTLLRAAAGLVPLTRGRLEVLGCDLVRSPRAVRRRVAMVGGGDGLYDELTVSENVAFWSRAARLPIADTEAALDATGVASRLRDVAVGRLSTGQRRRVGLALLVARRPELWLLDEPHAGLDPDGRDLVDDLVQRAAAAGATVVVATHDVERVGPLAHRAVTIAGGIVTDDTAGTAADDTAGTAADDTAGRAAAGTAAAAEEVTVAG